MLDFLNRYSRWIYVLMAVLSVIVAYVSKQYFLYISAIIMLLLATGTLGTNDDKDDDNIDENND